MTDAYHHQYDVNVVRPAAGRALLNWFSTLGKSLTQRQSQVHPGGV